MGSFSVILYDVLLTNMLTIYSTYRKGDTCIITVRLLGRIDKLSRDVYTHDLRLMQIRLYLFSHTKFLLQIYISFINQCSVT